MSLDTFSIRTMESKDVAAIHQIEAESYSYPWEVCIFERLVTENFYCLVVLQHEKVCGYCITLLGGDECHLLNFCIASCVRRHGVGRLLMQFLIQQLHHYCIKEIHLEVRESNIAAKNLYKTLGFTQVGRRQSYYPGEEKSEEREDAILLTLALEQC